MKTQATLSTFVCSAIAAALLTCVSSASTIALWQLAGQPGNQLTTMGVGSANVSALDMTRGSGLGVNTGSGSFNSNGWDGVDANDYISFGFTVDAGYEVKLASILLGTRSSNTGPGTLGLYSSIDNFANPIQQFQQTGDAYNDRNLDITALGLVSGSVEFRIFEIGDTQADGSGDTSSAGTFRLTDYSPPGIASTAVSVTGELTQISNRVPEGGASFMMLGLALCAIAATRQLISGR